MRICVLFFIVFMTAQTTTAQIHEAGLLAGGGNYIGDVGSTRYIAPRTPALGILYKWNTSPRYAYRASAMYMTIQGTDARSDIPARQDRNYEFKNHIKELSAGLEFNFLDFNLHEFGITASPYVYSGISWFFYNALYFNNGEALEYNTANAFAIPMAAGVKSNLLPHLVIGLEINARYTFTDNLDGSNASGSPVGNSGFGNTNSNDWYVFSGISLTYTFGRKPCYCTGK